MDQTSSWPPPATPPFLPPPSWQKQESSPSVKMQRDLDRFTGEPEAGPETHIQKLIASLDPAKIQEVAASQAAINDMYYKMALQHAQRLFRWALIAAGAGLIFFLVAVAFSTSQQPVSGALITLTSGGVLEAIAALNFCLYGRAFSQLREFHERWDRTQQYLLANSICQNLAGDVKQATQIELIRTMMHSLAWQEEKMKKSTTK